MDAIGPAWERAWEMVFEPFRLKRALKLGLVALVAAMGGLPSGSFQYSHGTDLNNSPLDAGVASILLIVFIIIGITVAVLWLVIFYFGSRMQFVLFEIVATRETTVAPKWTKFGRKTWPWYGIKILYLLITATLVVLAAVPFIVHLVRMIHANAAINNMQPGQVFHLMMGLLVSLVPAMIVGVVLCAGYVLVQDFVLPVYALEETGVFDALGKAFRTLCSKFWMTVLYLLMRIVLCIGLCILLVLTFLCALIVAAIPLAPTGVGLYYGLHNAGAGGIFLMVLGYIVEGLVLAAWLVVCGLVLCAFTRIFSQAYALYYFGGLYEPLGNLLEPPALPPTGVEAEPPLMA